MPKAKPEVVKMWMGWKPGWYLHGIIGNTKSDCEMSLGENRWGSDEAEAVEVRIVPEAEYQRLIAASKRNDSQ